MNLGIDAFTYADLNTDAGLTRLSVAFDRYVEEHDSDLFRRFDAYRLAMQSGVANGGLSTAEESALLIAVSRAVGAFLAQLFRVESGVTSLKNRARRDSEVARFKREFVAKRVAKAQSVGGGNDAAAHALIHTVARNETDLELALAITANRLLDLERAADAHAALDQLREHLDPNLFGELARRERVVSAEAAARDAAALHALIELLVDWTAAQWKAGAFAGWTSFRLPRPLVFDKLVPT